MTETERAGPVSGAMNCPGVSSGWVGNTSHTMPQFIIKKNPMKSGVKKTDGDRSAGENANASSTTGWVSECMKDRGTVPLSIARPKAVLCWLRTSSRDKSVSGSPIEP